MDSRAVLRPWSNHLNREQVRALLQGLAGRSHDLIEAASSPDRAGDIMDDGETMSLSETVGHVDISRSTLKRWLNDGKVTGAVQHIHTRHWIIPVAEVRALRAAANSPQRCWPPTRAYSNGMIQDVWRLLRNVLTFGASRGIDAWCLTFDVASIPVPSSTRPEATKPRMITVTECARIAHYLHPIHQFTLWLLRLLGVRISEAFGLQLRHLHWEHNRLFLAVMVMGGKPFEDFDEDGRIIKVDHIHRLKSQPSRRLIPVPAHLMALITDIIDIFHTEPDGTITLDRRLIPTLRGGGGQSAFMHALSVAAGKAQVDSRSIMDRLDPQTQERALTTHMGRKSYATDLRLHGVDTVTRQQLMGQSPDPDVHSQVYILEDPAMADRMDAIDRLQRTLEEVLPDGLAIPTPYGFAIDSRQADGARTHDALADLYRRGWLIEPSDGQGHVLLFSDDIAALAGVSPGTARRWLREGEIPAVRVDDRHKERWGATPADVEEFLTYLSEGRPLSDVAHDLGEEVATLRQRIHAQKLAFSNPGRVMIIPAATEHILRGQCERFRYLERHWIPLSKAHESAHVPKAVIRTWTRQNLLISEAGRGNIRYVDPEHLPLLARTYKPVSGGCRRR